MIRMCVLSLPLFLLASVSRAAGPELTEPAQLGALQRDISAFVAPQGDGVRQPGTFPISDKAPTDKIESGHYVSSNKENRLQSIDGIDLKPDYWLKAKTRFRYPGGYSIDGELSLFLKRTSYGVFEDVGDEVYRVVDSSGHEATCRLFIKLIVYPYYKQFYVKEWSVDEFEIGNGYCKALKMSWKDHPEPYKLLKPRPEPIPPSGRG